MREKRDFYADRDFVSKMTRGQMYRNAMVDKRNVTSDLVYTMMARHCECGGRLQNWWNY